MRLELKKIRFSFSIKRNILRRLKKKSSKPFLPVLWYDAIFVHILQNLLLGPSMTVQFNGQTLRKVLANELDD
jgi:hypothetical protein